MPVSVDEMYELVHSNSLLGQIALLYYRFSRHEQDNALADYVLKQAMELDIEKYYMERLFEEKGVTRKQWDRWARAASERVMKLEVRRVEIDESNNWVAQMCELTGLADFEVEEIDNVESTIAELGYPIGPYPFHVKLQALDTMMYNFHAGIAPFEILGVDREDLWRLAGFLKHATPRQLGQVVDEDPSTVVVETEQRVLPQVGAEGRFPSGTPIRFGDRRPVRVRSYRRRHR